MLLVYDKFDSDDGIVSDGDIYNEVYKYDDGHVRIKDDSIRIFKENEEDLEMVKNKIYFISSINSIEIIKKNIVFVETLALFVSSIFTLMIVMLVMEKAGVSNSSITITLRIIGSIFLIQIIFMFFRNYKNKFFIQISTSTGKEYIYFSEDILKIEKMFDVIVSIKNGSPAHSF